MAPSTRQHHIRPIIVIVAGLVIGGCSSPVVREYQLIRSLVLPAERGDNSIIATTDRSKTSHPGVGDDLGVQLHRGRTRSRSDQALVLEPISPHEPQR